MPTITIILIIARLLTNIKIEHNIHTIVTSCMYVDRYLNIVGWRWKCLWILFIEFI